MLRLLGIKEDLSDLTEIMGDEVIQFSFLSFNVVVAQTIKRPTFIKYCLDILYSLLRQIKMLLVHL